MSTRTSTERLDYSKTRMQEVGQVGIHGLSVADLIDIVESLGLDADLVRVFGGFGGSYIANTASNQDSEQEGA